MKKERSLFLRVLPDFLAFNIGLFAAYYLKWETTDLVWSLWFCSLVVGYLTLLIALGGGALIGLRVIRHDEFPAKARVPATLAGTAILLFILGFFSFHFCAFHAGHSVFLNHFFPVAGMPSDGMGDAFMNPPKLLYMAFQHLFLAYGIFLLPAIISERKHLVEPLVKAMEVIRTKVNKGDIEAWRQKRKTVDRKKADKNPVGDFMARPYLNVIRMHLLIFFFAGAYALKLESFFVYTVVYVVYFLPWRELKRLIKDKRAAKEA